MPTIIDLATLQPTQGFIVQGDTVGDKAGFSVSNAGDINGDGIDDFIVGAAYGDNGGTNAGEAYVIFGKAGAVRANIDLTSLAAADGFVIQGEATGDAAGWSVSGAGDINGDGIDDLIVGAAFFGTFVGDDDGKAYVIFGKTGATRANIDLSSLTASNGFSIEGDGVDDNAATSVSSAGDINGDGIDDLIVGAGNGDNGGANAGEAYVIFGKVGATRTNIDLGSLAATDGFIIQGDAAGDAAGADVSSAGDINGDGIDDLIVGAPRGDNGGTNAGEAYVIFGKAGATRANIDLTSLSASNGFIIRGDADNDGAGSNVSSAGDINGDGIGDLIVGATNNDIGGTNAGTAYVIFGRAGATRANIDLASLSVSDGFAILGEDTYDRAGSSVSAAGDIDGDGFDDLIVGAPGDFYTGLGPGAAYIIFGKVGATRGTVDLTDLATHQGIIIRGGSETGRSVSEAGDINDDGFADVIVGTPLDNTGGGDAGIAHIVYGRAALTDPGGSLLGTSGNDILNGTVLADSVGGLDGNDTIYTGAGNDILIGGTGSDFMDGGLGNDIYFVDNVGDTLVDAGGTDTVNSTISYVLATGLENLTLSGSGALQGFGNAANNTITANTGVNLLSGLGGDDIFVLGENLTATDTIDGGTGNDQVGISGDYSFTNSNFLAMTATTMTNVEVLAFLPGTGNRYGVNTHDNTVAAGQELVVFAGNLGVGQNVTFSGGLETDGFFRTFGGLGDDRFTGGALSDGFYFGPGKWQAGDTVTGAGGTNDQLALDGDYTTTIGPSANVEVLVLLAGPSGTPNTFNITLADTWTAAATTKTVFGRNVTTSLTINGTAETNGSFVIFGGRAGDGITGGAGNDQFYGLEGNDNLTGGLGSDTAIYQGVRASYSIVTGGGNVQIVDNDAVTDGNDGTDTVVGIEFARFSDQTISITSPIILDLDGGGVETLSASQSNAAYDMDGDGIGDDTSWFERGEGLLFLDRDGNGTLSNAGEMSFTNDVANARSDLEGLAAFDSNGDGQLSKADSRFRDFKIWRDRNGDGVVGRREIMTLQQAGVRSLSLSGTANNASYALGDTAVVNHGSFTRTNGRQGGLVDAVLTAFSSRATTDQSSAAAMLATDDPLSAIRSGMAAVDASAPDTTSFDPRVAMMAQDMASFGGAGADFANADTWRRSGILPMEFFAA